MIQKKIAILGSTAVGKTSLIRQYVEGIFNDKYLTSIGVKIDKKNIKLEHEDIQLVIWDIEGIDQYSHFNKKYLRGVSGVVVVADVTRSATFDDAKDILAQVKENAQVPCLLASNKTDLMDGPQDAQTCDIKSLFADTVDTSAKTGKNVEWMFQKLALLIMEAN